MLSASAPVSASALPLSAAPLSPPPEASDALSRLQGRLWRGTSLGRSADPTLPSGFAPLDAELPGGGWPLHAVTELLTPQAGALEWRLLAPALRHWWAQQAPPVPMPDPAASGPAAPRASAHRPARRPRAAAKAEGGALRSLLLIHPPHTPHLPGLQGLGLPASALVWVAARTPADRLWAVEQAIKARVAVLAWLPEAQPEHIRRLQVAALGSDAPAFLVRPEHAGGQSSAAPLRVAVKPGEGWHLAVRLLKRRGPAHDGWLPLPALPAALAPLLTAGQRAPHTALPPLASPLLPHRPHTAPLPPTGPTSIRPLPEPSHALARPVLHD